MGRKTTSNIIERILRSSKTVLIDVKRSHYKEALRLSSLSGIHIWDYLCIVPLRGMIDIAYKR
mgnify:CR=1 FL=1